MGARDVSHVGMDGVANYMQRKPAAPAPISEQIPSRKEKKGKTLLQHDRCPIKIGPTGLAADCGALGGMSVSQATAVQKRDASKSKELFKEIGKKLKDISRAKIEEWDTMTREIASPVTVLIGLCGGVKQDLQVGHLKSLLNLCLMTGEIINNFKQQKASRFLYNCGDLMGQIGSAASILTLLKPTLIPDCFAFCTAFENGVQDLGLLYAALHSKCSPGSSEFPAAFTLFILLDFFDPAIRTVFQQRVNASIVSTVKFIAMRCTEVVENHGLRTGILPVDITDSEETCFEEYPVPVRVYGRDVDIIWPEKLLGLNPPENSTCDPVANNGFYSFTEHGKPVRSKESCVNASGNLFRGESECKKPSWDQQSFTSRSNFRQMLFTSFCVVHSIFMGYHIIEGGEGRKDPYNALFLFKETCPQSISYDFVCG